MENRRALSVTEVSQILGVTYGTAYKWIRCGGVPHFIIGRTIRVWEEDLNKYIERIMRHD